MSDDLYKRAARTNKNFHLVEGANHMSLYDVPTRDADALLLALHWTRVDDVFAQAGTLTGKVLLTCSLPMSKDDTHMVIGLTTSGAEALATKIPETHVVSTFSTVPKRTWSRRTTAIAARR